MVDTIELPQGVDIDGVPPITNEEALRRDVDEIIRSRGQDDYVSILARILTSELNPNDFEIGNIAHMYPPISFVFDRNQDSPLTEEVVGFWDFEQNDPYYDTRPLAPVFDRRALQFLRRHSEPLRQRFPEMARVLDGFDENSEKKLKEMFPSKHIFTLRDVLFIRTLDIEAIKDTEETQRLAELYEIFGRDTFMSAKDLLKKNLSSVDDFDELWPQQYRDRIQTLSTRAKINLLGHLAYLTREHTRNAYNLRLFFNGGEELEDSILEDEIEEFVFDNIDSDFFTPELLSRISNVSPQEITTDIRKSILASLVTKAKLPELLTSFGDKGVVTLAKYRGLEFCSKTENRLGGEVQVGSALIIVYKYPDGQKVYVPVKFNEVTLGVTMDRNADHEGFQSSKVYLPVGESYKWVTRLHKNGVQYVEYEVPDDSQVHHVWAHTRPASEPIVGWDFISDRIQQLEASAKANLEK